MFSRRSLPKSVSLFASSLTLLLLLLLAPTSNAGEAEIDTRFLISYRLCSDQFPPHVISASVDYDQARSACYVRLVRIAMHDLPPSTPAMLYSALQSSPESAEPVFGQALSLGFEPYYAVTAATQALPQQSPEFVRHAIAFGADPSRVTEAAAAGHQIRPY